MCKLSREAVVRQLEQVKKEYGLLQKVLSHWADHSCLTSPRVVELVAAAKVLEMAHYRLAIDCNDCVCDEKLWDIGDGKRLRTALAAFKGEK